jgi:Predicted membrane protein (DUF2232)
LIRKFAPECAASSGELPNRNTSRGSARLSYDGEARCEAAADVPAANGWGGFDPSLTAATAGQLAMAQIILIALGTGTASALLFASLASGSVVATFLFYLSPLPLMIAALGWSHWAALLGGLCAAAGLGIALNAFFFVAFLVGVALPAWWLGYLSLLARPASTNGSGGVEWYPVGRLVFWAAMIGTLVVAVAVPALGTDKATVEATLRSAFEHAIRIEGQHPGSPAGRLDADLVDVLIAAIPPAAALLATFLSVFNLWLAAKIVNVSGRLRRPWPALSELTLPRFTAGFLGAAIIGSFLPDLLGVFAGVLAASLFMAYAIMGFAVLHAITRNFGSRAFALTATYVAVVILGWPILAMSLLGLAEMAFNIRNRIGQRRGPPTLRT